MMQELSPDASLKLAKQLRSVIHQPSVTNVQKLKMMQHIILRVTAEQKKEYQQLAKETKVPLSKIVRTGLNSVIVYKQKKKLSPNDLLAQFKAFQRKMNLIK